MIAPILRDRNTLRRLREGWARADQCIGVVPTMGALHPGHLSLVEAAKAACDRVIVTTFVNPTQFNSPADLDRYPRTEAEDAALLAPYAVDVVYAPAPEQVYPEGFATKVSVQGLTDVMEGAFRPGHFDGVATVVAKLFLQTGAQQAFFGEKDFQQLLVVRRMARDLDIPITVTGCPTVREPSGLALSSRNRRLSAAGRDRAAALYSVMRETARALAAGQSFAPLAQTARQTLVDQGFAAPEYFELRSEDALAPLERPSEPARLFVAAELEGVRLIDNIAMPAV